MDGLWRGPAPEQARLVSGRNPPASSTRSDIRYTRNKASTVVYAIVLGWPEQALLLRSLGTAAAHQPGKVAHVELLGSPENLHWQQTDARACGLNSPGTSRLSDYAVVFKLSLA